MAENKQEMLAEAYRRGILPDDKREAYEEAMRRGLVAGQEASPARQAADAGGMLVRGNTGHKKPGAIERGANWAVDGLTTGVGTLPGSHELGGLTNAAISTAYNAPGVVGDVVTGKGLDRLERIPEAYDSQVRATKGTVREFSAENPYSSSLARGTGYGLQGVGMAKLIPGAVTQTGNWLQDTIRTGVAGAAEGGLISGVYGFAETEGGLDDRLRGAQDYAKWGIGLGGAIGAGLRSAPVAWQAAQNSRKNSASGQVLEMARQAGAEPSRRSVNALIGLLKRAGISGKDIRAGLAEVGNAVNRGSSLDERASIFAVELQKRFPSAAKQIEDSFQQLATAPPKQGNTSQTLYQAIDDQQSSQGSYLDDIFQEKLGVATIADEQAVLAAERAAIGEVRDRINKFSATDARARGIRGQMLGWWRQVRNDREISTHMRAAARELGYRGDDEIMQALRENPTALFQKFGEVAGKTERAGPNPIISQARRETEQFVDDASRYIREDGNHAFAPKDTAPQGPYARQQQQFRENYNQKDAIAEARGRFQAARDPVKADEFVIWFNGLPAGEQRLVQTVIRQDMEKMLRGGNIDDAGAYLANLRKQGVHDVLVRILGREGEDISRAIQRVAEEQPMLAKIDPRAGMQARTVSGPAADKARLLYTNNPVARLSDKVLTPGRATAVDIGMIASSGIPIPYANLARQALKVLRPGTKTREGLAQIYAMRPTPGASRAGPTPAPTTPPPVGTVRSAPTAAVAAEQKLLPGPSAQPQPAPQPVPRQNAFIRPQEQEMSPAMQQQLTKKRTALLDADEQSLPPQRQAEIVERRENWHKQPQKAAEPQPQWVEYGHPNYPEAGPLKKLAAGAFVTSPVWGGAGLLAYSNMRGLEGTATPSFNRAMAALERVSKLQPRPSAPSQKPELPQPPARVPEGVLLSDDGTLYFDRSIGTWQPIQQLEGAENAQ